MKNKKAIILNIIPAIGLALALFSIQACEISQSDDIFVANRFLVRDLPRSTTTAGNTNFVPDNYRTHFVVFSIATDIAEEKDYRLGLKEASKPAPTASELTDAGAAITRTLSTNKINVYLPFHIEGTYFDTGVAQNYKTARATLLSANTEYKLYITPADGSGQVSKLLDMTTDLLPTDNSTDFVIYGLPPSTYEYTIRDGEALILQAMVWSDENISWLDNDKDWKLCSAAACIPFPPSLLNLPSTASGEFYLDGVSNPKNYIAVVSDPSGKYSVESTKDRSTVKLDTGNFLVQYQP